MIGRARLPARLIALCALLAGVASPARAQYASFGQNKIQYRDFDWHVLAGPHVDVYYYPAEERIARVALSYAEESYDVLAKKFNHVVRSRIPLIVYASHTDFEQTNILPFVPPEGILGVTDYMKRRVTLPFRGSYSEFRHTLRHEMVHVFQLSVLTQQFEMYPRARRAGLPLWWSEGLAEYWSSPQDSRDQMVVRDLSLNSNLPTIDQLNFITSPIVYPLGGELHHFLAEKYGDWRINLVYQSLWKYPTFEEVLKRVYGRTSRQLTEEWQYSLRQKYYPSVEGRKPFQVAGRELADLAVKPMVFPRADSGMEVAYLSPRSGYTNIYRTPLDERRNAKTKVVVAGERSPEFESLHAFSSRMDARDGVLLFASKFGDRDALFFWDVNRNKVVGRYQFDSLVAVISPSWSNDGRRVVFSGLTNAGVSDLFTLEMSSGTLTRITDDVYEDLDALWLPGDRGLVFTSDRGRNGIEGSRNIYRIDLATSQVTPLTSGEWVDETPRWDTDEGRIIFASDRDGTFNLYSVDTLGNGRRETTLDGGVFDPAPVPGDPRVVVAGFSRLSWGIYALSPDTSGRVERFALAPDSTTPWKWAELSDTTIAGVRGRRYKRDYSLDFATGGSDIRPGYGAISGGVLYFSDLLGDNAIAASFALYQGGGASELLSNLNFDLFYLNQKRRLNWGVGVFRLAGSFYENYRFDSPIYTERSMGAYGALRYPLSRFTRVEAQGRLEYSTRSDFQSLLVQGTPERRGVLASNYLSLVSDNALWLETGPIDGARWNLTGGVISDITHGTFENWLGMADARKYFRTSSQSAFAFRGFGYFSEGIRPRAIPIGGTWMLRAYPRFYVDGTRAWLFNSEWRFPITHFVTLGFPFGAVRFPQVQGALFNDLAQAWNKANSISGAFDVLPGNSGYDKRILGSYGLGFRMGLIPGLVLRLDLSKRYSIANGTTHPNFYGSPRVVEFFFGYNY